MSLNTLIFDSQTSIIEVMKFTNPLTELLLFCKPRIQKLWSAGNEGRTTFPRRPRAYAAKAIVRVTLMLVLFWQFVSLFSLISPPRSIDSVIRRLQVLVLYCFCTFSSPTQSLNVFIERHVVGKKCPHLLS